MPITRTRRGVTSTLVSTPDPIEARDINITSMTRWVLGMREIARAKPRAEAEAWLLEWSDWLAAKMDTLPDDSAGWAGLTALDLANAQSALVASI